MEERIVHPVKYNDEGKPTAAEFEYPKIYHNGNFFFGAHVFCDWENECRGNADYV